MIYLNTLHLRAELKEKYKLNDDGVLISEKMAKKIGAKVGDEIYFKESDTVRYNDNYNFRLLH